LTAHKKHGRDCTDYRAKSRSYRYEPNIENARVPLAPTLDELVAVCLIAPNLDLSVRKRTFPAKPYGPASVVYELIEPFSGATVHHFLLSPIDVMEACKSFTPPRH
jgi:hypothetical protein